MKIYIKITKIQHIYKTKKSFFTGYSEVRCLEMVCD